MTCRPILGLQSLTGNFHLVQIAMQLELAFKKTYNLEVDELVLIVSLAFHVLKVVTGNKE